MQSTLSVDHDVVVVELAGEFSRVESDTSRRAAADLARREGLRRFLVDLSGVTTRISTSDVFEICASHVELLPPGTRLAVVFSSEVQRAADGKFAENVSENRGTHMRAFTEKAAAKVWLQEKVET